MTSPHKNSLTTRIVIGMILGIALGSFLQWLMPNGKDLVLNVFLFELSLQNFLVDGVLEIIGLAIICGIVGYIWIIIGGVYFQVHSYRYLTANKVLDGEVQFEALPRTGFVIKTYLLGSMLVGTIFSMALSPAIVFMAMLFMEDFSGVRAVFGGFIVLVTYIVALVIGNAASMTFIYCASSSSTRSRPRRSSTSCRASRMQRLSGVRKSRKTWGIGRLSNLMFPGCLIIFLQNINVRVMQGVRLRLLRQRA